MISITRSLFAICQTLLLASSLILANTDDQISKLLAATNQNHHNIPGHYEFEVAPKMEPPSVRKPPYLQSIQMCPGSDPFAGFSPKDTLCGDLNQGHVPVNPLGQSITDQSYPFELIKNKTLQFLARALPILKLEYETIPKVARFVPPNQLLNPTHQASPLSNEHLNQINQRFAAANGLLADDLLNAPYLMNSQQRKRRKKRSLAPQRQAGGSITAAELVPNTTLLVSSAHSSPFNRARNESSPRLETGVITKDGYKSIQVVNATNKLSSQPSSPAQQNRAHDNGNNWAPNVVQQTSSYVVEDATTTDIKDSKQVQLNSNRPSNGNNAGDNKQQIAASNANVSSSHMKPHTNHAMMKEALRGNDNIVQARSNGDSGTSSSVSGGESKQEAPAKRSKIACSESGNGFTSAICQAAAALIEGDRPPAWLQLAKHIGNAYAGSSDNLGSSSNPIWTVLGGLAQESSGKSSNSLAQTKTNLMNILGPLTSYLTGTSSSLAASKEFSTSSDYPSSTNNKEQSALASIGSSTLTRLALAGWASNAIASLVEYFVPTVFQSASRTFAKRKKPFDPQETFIDTPASVAAAISAANMPLKQQSAIPNKQPPTPCPSVEEYISPTFARNYQGAWKYVVQIPHEGYFTQTIQRTSCVRQKCEFTEGVCHESPRWVSLLVAEIYYPNTIYGSAGQQQAGAVEQSGQSQLSTASSTNSIQQMALAQQQQQQLLQQHHSKSAGSQGDPLQMTDSLNNYNHNLNNAFINAANELGWDPNNVANMQHLANAYNYQLLQRNGMLNGQQVAESRASHTYAPPNQYPTTYATQTTSTVNQQPLGFNTNEYIAALAAATLQQNPNMSINDLINSLQLQRARKKRDTSNLAQQKQHQQVRRSQVYNQVQARPNIESLPSINDIGSPLPQSQHVTNQNNMLTSTTPNQPIFKQMNIDTQSATNSVTPPQQAPNVEGQQAPENSNQSECDGHDKIGCYVVRVYYDWFLVNGSCKCWKTTSGSSGTSTSNSFLRRIFTG